jgi:hypothetical protein
MSDRDERWLSRRLGVEIRERAPLVTRDAWVWLADWLATRLGCDVDVEFVGYRAVSVVLGPDCPTQERGAALVAVVDHTPPGFVASVAWWVRGWEVAA